jgi:hypothetical protein
MSLNVLSSYSVHTLGIAVPLAMPRANSQSNRLNLPLSSQCILSAYQVHLQEILYIHGMTQYFMGTHYAMVQYHLVLLYHSTYHLVELVTVLGNS